MLRVALPKGAFLSPTAELLKRAGWGLEGYEEEARFYRIRSKAYPDLAIKMFQEKDIPIQVSIGNYDLGICGLDWAQELLSRYPASSLVKLKDLGYGDNSLYAATAPGVDLDSLERVRAASEYPNITQSWLAQRRMRHFAIYPLWGAAAVYPPENADVVIISSSSAKVLAEQGLEVIEKLFPAQATLVANRESLRTKDMSGLVASIINNLLPDEGEPCGEILSPPRAKPVWQKGVRLALPDGHQQAHVSRILEQAGITVEGYPSIGNRRPTIGLDGFSVKVIRPQDMPLQVANGQFDLAITGRDWLYDHLYQFPSSGVLELLDLKYGWVKIVAAVSQDVPVDDARDLFRFYRDARWPVRVASEYINIADYYARTHRLGSYRIVPTWGATEAFPPEDAEILIENTETGKTLLRNNLKIVDVLVESTACLISSEQSLSSKGVTIEGFVQLLKGAL